MRSLKRVSIFSHELCYVVIRLYLRSSLEKLVNASEDNRERYLAALQTSPIAQHETFPQALRNKLDKLARKNKGKISLNIAYWGINEGKERDLRLASIAEVIEDICLKIYSEKNLGDVVKIADALAALPYKEGPFTAHRMADRLLKNQNVNPKKSS